MKRLVAGVGVTVLTWAVCLAVAPAALAATTECNGELTPASVIPGDVNGAANADCAIIGATVPGSVFVQPRGTITILGGQIGGNLVSQGASNVRIGDCGEFGGCPGPLATHIAGNAVINSTSGVPSFPVTNVICDGTSIGGA